ncbi:MAG: reverse transcriptase family protein, partial [Anaplasma sp.]|nr:reverse transcriptase family protein [Anaplasma sp.]
MLPPSHPILAKLFTNSLRAGSVPRQGKTARITPIHKGNRLSKSLVSSYRPISTTSIACKTMERIVKRHLLEHIEQHQLLSPHQYGFRPGRSCELALATTVHTISSSLDGRTPCELIQLDFKQAFDRVHHSILLKKLSDIGVSGNFLKWITSFLLGRTQRVVFGGEMSSLAE